MWAYCTGLCPNVYKPYSICEGQLYPLSNQGWKFPSYLGLLPHSHFPQLITKNSGVHPLLSVATCWPGSVLIPSHVDSASSVLSQQVMKKRGLAGRRQNGAALVAGLHSSLSSATSRSEMNSSAGDLGVGDCSSWDDPTRFFMVLAAYALALGLGLQPTWLPGQCLSTAAGAWARPCVSTCSTWPWPMCCSHSCCCCGSPTTWAWPTGPSQRLPATRPGRPTTCPPTLRWPSSWPPSCWCLRPM
uniref:transmembrane protein n=1 Tax=Callithrix jacchus TaxID=9483 RepID=UPI00159D31E9|nr:transmembrane protein [Callithrix jacchus]